MFFAVSTVKDTLDNVRFFVEANLAGGVDHLLVVLDDPAADGQDEVRRWLDAHPHVTCLPGDRSWWVDGRPRNLNRRQRTNACWALALLEPFPWATWLAHVDGDEVVLVDPAALAAAPEGADVLHLAPWEAVSTWDATARPTRFKRLLDEPELVLLHALGHLGEASNQAYFHGHVMGKSAVRPASGLGLTLHHAARRDGRTVPGHADPGLRVLHFDAPSGEEFVRKWTALAHAGPARYRASRAGTAKALRHLVTADLPDDVRARYLERLYRATTEDPVDVLDDLGLLVAADPLAAGRTPAAWPPGARSAYDERLSRLRAAPKGPHYVPDPEPAAPAPRPARGTGRFRRRAARLARLSRGDA